MTSQRNKSPEKGAKKKVNKIDEHIEQAGIDNLESFTDPQTNVIYYRLKVLGKGGFAKGNFCHFDQNQKTKKSFQYTNVAVGSRTNGPMPKWR